MNQCMNYGVVSERRRKRLARQRWRKRIVDAVIGAAIVVGFVLMGAAPMP
jgi:hypothetical protein